MKRLFVLTVLIAISSSAHAASFRAKLNPADLGNSGVSLGADGGAKVNIGLTDSGVPNLSITKEDAEVAVEEVVEEVEEEEETPPPPPPPPVKPRRKPANVAAAPKVKAVPRTRKPTPAPEPDYEDEDYEVPVMSNPMRAQAVVDTPPVYKGPKLRLKGQPSAGDEEEELPVKVTAGASVAGGGVGAMAIITFLKSFLDKRRAARQAEEHKHAHEDDDDEDDDNGDHKKLANHEKASESEKEPLNSKVAVVENIQLSKAPLSLSSLPTGYMQYPPPQSPILGRVPVTLGNYNLAQIPSTPPPPPPSLAQSPPLGQYPQYAPDPYGQTQAQQIAQFAQLPPLAQYPPVQTPPPTPPVVQQQQLLQAPPLTQQLPVALQQPVAQQQPELQRPPVAPLTPLSQRPLDLDQVLTTIQALQEASKLPDVLQQLEDRLEELNEPVPEVQPDATVSAPNP
ncbi:hypothetical protein HDE_08598 [Halotydeus destructor]|nr:hypothetical protein HDE_08598 [Halotydeus destructor]